MASKVTITVALLSSFASLVAAQQGVLVNGNSQLPQCAQQCPTLNAGADSCYAGGPKSGTQQHWSCFCQSSFLTQLPTSAAGICDSTCTNPTDQQQLSAWYKSNCGTDFGASEHPGDGAAQSSAPAASSSSATAANAAATATNTASSSQSGSGGGISASAQAPKDWWSEHYKWIIMLIVLAICLPLLAFLAIWLKRRHDRKADHMREGFNAGITERSAPMSNPNLNHSDAAASGAIDGSGRNSPARTRDAFMPYGYGYNRSESRMGSKQAVGDDRRSPLARGATPSGDPEKDVGMTPADTPAKKKSRKVLVRERSAEDSIETEKNSRYM